MENTANTKIATDESTVRVIVRIRPRAVRENIDACQICTTVTPGQPQIWMGGNHAFTFDDVHDVGSTQVEVFSTVESLVDGCVEGYNATILAYGQTGSGKTYTMGTGFDVENRSSEEIAVTHGIIPRAVHHLFKKIKTIRQEAMDEGNVPPDFLVQAQFVELHNEEINDLISPASNNWDMNTNTKTPSSSDPSPRSIHDGKSYLGTPSLGCRQGKQQIKIHEDANGQILLNNAVKVVVNSVDETMNCLRDGALVRSTASTNMNDSSSRSHAIFTIHVDKTSYVKTVNGAESSSGADFQMLSAKFHFVDLAGSERLKRTGAVGERAKEGISINCGLLALGNVISALGDTSRKVLHVPYRDSKLTRLLQDSLGGNSRTIMIACISPCDRDFVETLNTLKYANRARNIKNKLTVNQDKSSRIISSLREAILRLETELQDYKQGKVTMVNGTEFQTDIYQENLMLTNELEKLRHRVKALQETVDRITAANTALIAEKACGSMSASDGGADYTDLVRKYIQDIEELRAKLFQSEAECELLRKKQSTTAALLNQSLSPRPHTSRAGGTSYAEHNRTFAETESVSNLITAAHTEIRNHEMHKRKLRKKLKRRQQRSGSGGSAINGTMTTDENRHDTGDDDSLVSSEAEGEDEDDPSEDELEDGEVEGIIQGEIVSIDDEINTKQKLIAQLELSNKRALDTKEQYETQIQILVTKIKRTEDERDSVLTSLKPTSGASAKVKQIKEEFEAKLAAQTKDLTRLREALKEHDQLIRKSAATEKRVETLKSEVETMKKLKVKLQNQLREENTKFRETDAKRMKEILQLKKEGRKKEVQIRALESKEKLKDQILKRKMEEVSALKKQNKSVFSRRAGGRLQSVPVHKRQSPAKAKKKWAELQSAFEKRASDRRQMEQMELEMLTHIQTRKKALDEIDQLEAQIRSGNYPVDEVNRFGDQIDSLRAALEYSDDRISQSQRDICELASGSPKTDEQIPDISLAMEHFTKEDCEYLMQKMYEFTMENVGEYKQTAAKLSIAEEQVNSLNVELVTANELLSHMFSKYCKNDPNLSPDLAVKINNARATNRCRKAVISRNGPVPTLESEFNGESLVKSESEVKSPNGKGTFPGESPTSLRRFVRRQIPVEPSVEEKQMSKKARRLTSSRRELMGDLPVPIAPAIMDDGFVRPAAPVDLRANSLTRTSSLRMPNDRRRLERRDTFTVIMESGSGLPTTDSLNNVTGPQSKPLSGRRKTNTMAKALRPPNSAPNGVPGSNSEFSYPPTDNFNADTTFLVESSPLGTVSAPGSPGTSRRVVNENVFQRLTSTTSGTSIEHSAPQGLIKSIRERTNQKSIFQQTHVANGHSKAVLDICSTEDRLFTTGKDLAVKIWDLERMKEIRTITAPAIVTRVKFDEATHLLFCASGCYVRIYDVRKNTCINTLSSAGICYPSEAPPESYSQYPSKEQQIAAIALTSGSKSLYTSYGHTVRLWDMRNFSTIGMITGKHQSQVMCMEFQSGKNGCCTLVTGGKDHCIKVYAYGSDEPLMNISIPPKATLDPPHYDGIECLAVSGSTLFSGSRDQCIKKWDLSAKDGHHVMAYPAAHTNWVTGLCLPPAHPQYLVSASRDGMMKAWNKDSGLCLGQVEAHKGGVNCLASNKTAFFTGSNEDKGIISFWKLRNQTDSSGESSPLTGSPDTST